MKFYFHFNLPMDRSQMCIRDRLLGGQNRPPVYTIIVICMEYLVNRYADDFLPCNM